MYVVYARDSERHWWWRKRVFRYQGDAKAFCETLAGSSALPTFQAVACPMPDFVTDQFELPRKLNPKYNMARYLASPRERWTVLFRQWDPELYTPELEPTFDWVPHDEALWAQLHTRRRIGWGFYTLDRIVFVHVRTGWAVARGDTVFDTLDVAGMTRAGFTCLLRDIRAASDEALVALEYNTHHPAYAAPKKKGDVHER
jgi:hypothetical protein